MGVTAAMAVMSIVLVEVAGIRQKGTKGWLKRFLGTNMDRSTDQSFGSVYQTVVAVYAIVW